MTPERLCEIGEVLWGPEWKSAMARFIGVEYRTVLRWASGRSSVPDYIQARLAQRADAMSAMIEPTIKFLNGPYRDMLSALRAELG